MKNYILVPLVMDPKLLRSYGITDQSKVINQPITNDSDETLKEVVTKQVCITVYKEWLMEEGKGDHWVNEENNHTKSSYPQQTDA